MFIDKDQLLTEFNHLYQTQDSCCLSLYSYPGQGKTTLLGEFLKGKRALYYKASCVPWQENFRLLRDLCIRSLGSSLENVSKTSDLIKALKKASRSEPLVLVLDDFQYLSSKNRRLYIQLSALEKENPSCRLFVILCKSSSLWDKEASKESHSFCLRNFNFFETCRLYPGLSYSDQILLYGVTGGNPGLLKYFPPQISVCESLESLFFQEKGPLYRLTAQRLQKYYGSSPFIGGILGAIGSSFRHLQEICDKTGLTPSAASSLLGSLENHGITKKIVPVTEDSSSRRALYKIWDGAFRFWYTYVYPFQSEIESGKGGQVFRESVLPGLSDYLKAAFEDICRDFLRLEEKRGSTPFPMEQIGMWWGQHPTKKRTEYISIAASGQDQILLGACFLTDEWLDADSLSGLQKHAGLFPDREKWYYLFSTSDFVSGFEAIFGNHVRVFSLEEMCRIMSNL